MSNTEQSAYHTILEQWQNYSVILADSYALATSLNVAKARSNQAGAFGAVVSTFNAWIDGLWEQHGTGEGMVSQTYSVLLMRLMLDGAKDGLDLVDTPNLPIAASKCAARGSGIAAFEASLADHSKAPVSLSPAEESLLTFIAQYRSILSEKGLVERGCAVAWLAAPGGSCAQALASPAATKVLYVSNGDMPTLQKEFFASLGSAVEVVHLTQLGEPYQEGPAPVAPLPQQATLSFAWPLGMYARPQVLGSVIQRALVDGPIVITAKDPYSTYESLSGVFGALQCRAAVRARMPFTQTDIGRVYSALHEAFQYDQAQGLLLALADLLAAPLFGMRDVQLRQVKADIRANRLARVGETLGQLVQESPAFGHLFALVQRPSQESLVALHECVNAAHGYTPADKSGAHASLDVLGGFLLAAVDLGVPEEKANSVVYPLLAGASVAVSQANYATEVGESPDVLVVSQWQAASLDASQCATLVVDDLNSSNYSAAMREDAVSTFLAHVGAASSEDYLNKQRRTFAALLALPSKHVVLGRTLHDADMAELYPAAMLEEFLEANNVSLPPMRGKGPTGNAGGGFPLVFPGSEDNVLADILGQDPGWSAVVAPKTALPPVGSQRAFLQQEYLSPSSLEVFHECPRKWFLSRWLGIETPGEGFGPLERGSFIHECVQQFYARFAETGHAKVTSNNIDQARAIIRDVVEDARVEQYKREPGSWEKRYVAMPGVPSEEAQYLSVQRMLADAWVDVEAEFLAGTSFVPTLFEYQIDQLEVEVGGAPLKGRVDRIDIDDRGNLLVVDYKGSIGGEYATPIGEAEPSEVLFSGKKVQTLLYAAALRNAGRLVPPEGATPAQLARIDAFNKRCECGSGVAGAVYFSYNGRIGQGCLRCAGFFCESSGLTADQLLLSGKDSNAYQVPAGKEDAFFSSVESLVASVRARQQEGAVEAQLPQLEDGTYDPVCASICHWCPDETCERRQA